MYFRYRIDYVEDPKDTSYRPTVEDMYTYLDEYVLDVSLRYVYL
jgi:hypothetical protein